MVDSTVARSSLLRRHGITAVLCVVALLPRLMAGQQGVAGSLFLFLGVIIVTSWRSGATSAPVAALIGVLSMLAFIVMPQRTLITAGPGLAMGLAALALAAMSVDRLMVKTRRSERKLRRQWALTNAVRAHLQDGVCILDREGHLTSMNPAAQQMLGWRAGEVDSRDVREVLQLKRADGAQGFDQLEKLDTALHASAPVHVDDARFSRNDGTTFPVVYIVTPIIIDGQVTDVVLTFHDTTDQKQVEVHRTGERFYRTLVETAPDSMLVTDLYGYVVMANRQAAELRGYDSPEQLVGMGALSLLSDDSRRQTIEDKRKRQEVGVVSNAEYTYVKRDGTTVPVEVHSSLITDEAGKPQALIITERDIAHHKQAERTLRASKEHVSIHHTVALILAQSETLGEIVPTLLQTICQRGQWDVGMFWAMDTSKGVLRCDDMWHLSSGKAEDFDTVSRQLVCPFGVDLPGRVWQGSQPVWIDDVILDPGFRRALMASKDGLHTAFCFPVISGGMLHGVMEFFSCEIRPVDHDLMQAMTTIGASIGQFMKRREVEAALEHQALHDALTTLPNRVLFQNRLERALPVARGERGYLAVLLLDLDRFKNVNDSFGHRHGDLLLQQTALRLQTAVRESDTVARLGGDEFALLLPTAERAGAVLVANKILQSLQQPVVVEKDRLDVGASIGIALYPEHGEDAAMLLQHADIAMYMAKRNRSDLCVYTAQEDDHSPSRFALSLALREAIEQDQLLLHYQPKINIRSGQVEMVEALVRWQHPQRELLLPDEFIPLAEETGSIRALTHWVLREALRQCAWWQDVGVELCVAVNLSTQSLHDPGLLETIGSLFEDMGVEPWRLTVEITESALMADSSRALETLARLHEMGVRIAVDDFGTGYSSLTHLRHLTVDEIKIDKSFVMDLLANENDAHITQSVIDLGHNLGLEVVAEGIEDEGTWDRLVAMGCDQVQGYYLSRPIPAAELTSWLTNSLGKAGEQGQARTGSHLRLLDRSSGRRSRRQREGA